MIYPLPRLTPAAANVPPCQCETNQQPLQQKPCATSRIPPPDSSVCRGGACALSVLLFVSSCAALNPSPSIDCLYSHSLAPPPSVPSAQLLPGFSLGSPCRPAGGQQGAAWRSQHPGSLSLAGCGPRPYFLSPDLGPAGRGRSDNAGASLLGVLGGARLVSRQGKDFLRILSRGCSVDTPTIFSLNIISSKVEEAPANTRSGGRTHAGCRPLDLKSNAFTARPSWF